MTLAVITDYMGDDTPLERALLHDQGIEAGDGLRVRAYDPYAASGPSYVGRADSTGDSVADAHVLSLHAPLTPETRGAIGTEELAALRHPVSAPPGTS